MSMKKVSQLDHILLLDNFITRKECDKLIDFYNQQQGFIIEDQEAGYEGYNITDYFNDPAVSFMKEKMNSIASTYTKKFPEIYYTDYWRLEEIRFKKWKAGNWFRLWHQEHSMLSPRRILSLMLYLSDHDCGTEFFKGKVIKSKKGRLAVWPAYFTHAHRGQKCPQNLTRFVISAYFALHKGQS